MFKNESSVAIADLKVESSNNNVQIISIKRLSSVMKKNSITPNVLTDISTSNEENDNDYKFQWCCIKPSFCKMCQNWVFIFVIINLCVFIQNLVTSGIGTVIVSTMEKEFYMTSTESGLFLGIFDLAAFLSSPIIGYFGGLKNANKMRIISIALLLVSFGAYIIGLTVFAKQPDAAIYGTDASSGEQITTCLVNSSSSEECRSIISTSTETAALFTRNIKVLLFIANFIIGCGSVALYSVGIAYIEEIVNPKKSSICQAVFYGLGAIGGGIGILITGQFLNFNSRFYLESYKYTNLTTKSTNWIGCWWMPWLVYGFLCNIIAIYAFGFPRKVKKTHEEEVTKTDLQSTQDAKQARLDAVKQLNVTKVLKTNKLIKWLKDRKKGFGRFLKDFKSIVANIPFLCLALASATEGILLKGFLGFISKFFEYQYQLSSTNSTIITGAIAIFSVIFGSLIGAFIISKFNFNAVKSSLFVTIIYLITSFAFWFLVLSCKEDQFEITTDNSCKTCGCSNIYDPVCINYNTKLLMYQSACHAGCTTKITSDKYTNCTCLLHNQANRTLYLQAKLRNETLSFSNCDKNVKCLAIMIAGCCVAFFIVFLTSVALIPHLKAIMGTIDKNKQSFALGIRTAIIRVIGNFIGPIIFGYALDSACLFWKTNCYGQKVCKIYNNQYMSILLAAMGFTCRFTSFIFCLIAFLILKYREKRDLKLEVENKIKENRKNDSEKRHANNVINEKSMKDQENFSNIEIATKQIRNKLIISPSTTLTPATTMTSLNTDIDPNL